MANNQITPFQLTDQFTMDNFNQRINETNTSLQNKADTSSVYTKTETDTLLQNKAPAGYGLGETEGKRLDNTDLNTVLTGGVYRVATGCTNTPPLCNDSWSGLIVIPTRKLVQIYLSHNGNSDEVNDNYTIAVRTYKNGYLEFDEWEYINPAMALGVEYRTTERYRGKPVYAMAVDFGNLPNATTKEITVSGVSYPDKVVSVFGYTSDSKTIPTFSYAWGNISTISDAISLDAYAHPVDGLRIHVGTQQNRSSATAVVVVKYTKSTD